MLLPDLIWQYLDWASELTPINTEGIGSYIVPVYQCKICSSVFTSAQLSARGVRLCM